MRRSLTILERIMCFKENHMYVFSILNRANVESFMASGSCICNSLKYYAISINRKYFEKKLRRRDYWKCETLNHKTHWIEPMWKSRKGINRERLKVQKNSGTLSIRLYSFHTVLLLFFFWYFIKLILWQ